MNTDRCFEYQNAGPGARSDGRVRWVRRLTRDEARMLTPGEILGGLDQWDPGRSE